MQRIVRKGLADDVRDALLRSIRSMDLSRSSKLPPESELGAKLGVSRITIRRALSDLENDGIVVRLQGRGTYVNRSALQIKVDLSRMKEFGQVIRQSGHSSSCELLSVRTAKANDVVAKALDIPEGAGVYQIIRLYKADGIHAILSDASIPVSLFPSPVSQGEWKKGSNFMVLARQCGILVISDKIEVSCIDTESLSSVYPVFKEFPCKAVLDLTGIGFEQGGKPVIYGRSFYNTDVVKFDMFRKS